MINKFQNVVDNVDQLDDLNESKKSVRELLPEGTAIVQLVRYIEVGIQNNRPIQGKAKAPTNQCYIGVNIIGGGSKKGNEPFQPYCKDGKPIPLYSSFAIDISQNEKARYFNTFKAFNYAGTARHFVQLLGTIALLKIGVKVEGDKSYQEFDLRSVTAPTKDAMSGTVYEAGKDGVLDSPDEDYQCFIWDMPDQSQWDSIFIDGEYEREVNGTKTMVSKNKFQELIQNANNFIGSPTEALLMGVS